MASAAQTPRTHRTYTSAAGSVAGPKNPAGDLAAPLPARATLKVSDGATSRRSIPLSPAAATQLARPIGNPATADRFCRTGQSGNHCCRSLCRRRNSQRKFVSKTVRGPGHALPALYSFRLSFSHLASRISFTTKADLQCARAARMTSNRLTAFPHPTVPPRARRDRLRPICSGEDTRAATSLPNSWVHDLALFNHTSRLRKIAHGVEPFEVLVLRPKCCVEFAYGCLDDAVG